MQKSTGKELAAIKTIEIGDLLKEAIDHHEHTEAARSAVTNGQQLALFHAWQAGIRLNKIKALIGHGHWQGWLEINFCTPRGVSYRTAAIYMKIDNDNPQMRDVKAKVQRVALLEFDTIRKHAIGFVPNKDQPEHKGNVTFDRLVSFLNIANEFARLKQRHIEGLHSVDFNEAREETVELYQFLGWLHGDIAGSNPWNKAPV